MTSKNDVLATAERARIAARVLAPLSRARKDEALHAMADALVSNEPTIVAANERDVAAGRAAGMNEGLLDRLTLTPARIQAMAQGLRETAALPDPVGEVVRGSTLANGLRLAQYRVPLGVVAMIYEARPNVTVDAAGLCLKSGNAAVLRGSGSAYQSNMALTEILADAIASVGLPRDAIVLVPGTDRESVTHLMGARGLVDVIIPRGGAGLISHVVENSIVPVIETGVGNCHVYVDAAADLDMAEQIVINAKTQRISVCNAAEKLLVHADIADDFVPRIAKALNQAGVVLHGDERVCALVPEASAATDDDWTAEYLALEMAIAIVDGVEGAAEHISRWSSGHTEAIISTDSRAIDYFIAHVDSAAIMVNASTRFTDGAEFGFGAEIGISTQKLHARGPMGLAELTSTKYVVRGDGHVRH
ncbi:MAG: glutamate-5-semialdehyde dehydrogenase [Corynebacteriales bacterium]|nr:glutamate-5-semialdehyde dehydrogenase [Mycobacteriales bacterium]